MSYRTEMKLDLPDILSLSRVVGAVLLLFTTPLSLLFLAVYGYCCITDVLDGFLARRSRSENRQGQILDSTADIVLTVCLLACLIPFLPWEGWMITWIAIIAVIRIISLGIGSMRFGQIALLHTYGNKTSAFLRYLAPFLLAFVDLTPMMIVLCTITTLTSLEDLYINLKSNSLDSNVRSVLSINDNRVRDQSKDN